jgi:predicted CXXCH cytochrome family protein
MRVFHLEMMGEPCERCERAIGVSIHHRTHRSQRGSDVRENFEWLCARCHDRAHGLTPG